MTENLPGSGRATKEKGKGMRTETERATSGRSGAKVDERIQAEIGKQLRALYEPIVNEPVPSKFIDLLEQLERSTRKD